MIIALYLRLSKKDNGMACESNSITNQRHILYRFVEQRQEFKDYEIKEYIDDGFSGKNFNRPGIQELLEDAESGKVYSIIVKDFSRFGRNYIEAGNYIEKIFPLQGIRFIAVNNNFDSENYTMTTPDMDVAFENLMYDYFSEESSIKIKNALMGRRISGKYLATFAAFGYKKLPYCHNHIIIDEEAAAIVRMIFEKYAECRVKAEVARYLNYKGIPTPQAYAARNGYNYNWKYQKEKKLWNGSIVGRILKNEIYTGNTVFHKKEAASTGTGKIKCLPKDKWKVCKNTHEPIISRELFELVNSQDKKALNQSIYCESEKRKRGSACSPVKGLVKCGGCKHNMQRRNRINVSYYCRYHYEARLEECCKDNVKEADIVEIVLLAIKHQALVAGAMETLQELYQQQLYNGINIEKKEEKQLQKKIQELADKNFSLYESYVKGSISASCFMQQKENNNNLAETYKAKMQAYQTKRKALPNEGSNMLKLAEDNKYFTDVTKKLARQLVDVIYVYSNKRIKVVFKFQDENAEDSVTS